MSAFKCRLRLIYFDQKGAALFRHWPPQTSPSSAADLTNASQSGADETLADLERLVEHYESCGMIRPKGVGEEPHVLSGVLDAPPLDLHEDSQGDHAESHASDVHLRLEDLVDVAPPLAVADNEERADDAETRAVGRPGIRTVAIVTALALIGVAGAFANKMWSSADPRTAAGDAVSATAPAGAADNARSVDVAKASSRPQESAPADPVVPERETQSARPPRQIMPTNDPYGLAPPAASGSAPRQAVEASDRTVPTNRISTGGESNPRVANDPPDTSATSAPVGKLTALDPARVSVAPQTPQASAAAPTGVQAPAGAYVVQLSSQRSEAAAQATSRLLQSKHPTMFADLRPFVRRSDLAERGVYYRALVGPFTGFDKAREFCGNLKKAGGDCVVLKN